MDDVCRICNTQNKKMTPLLKRHTSKSTLQLETEGEEFEYCFGLQVMEVPDCIKICARCQNQLRGFYSFKQRAIKSHYELLDKSNLIKKMKKCVDFEIVECNASTNSKSDTNFLEEDIKNESEYDEIGDEELQEIENIPLEMVLNDHNKDARNENDYNVQDEDDNRSEKSTKEDFEQTATDLKNQMKMDKTQAEKINCKTFLKKIKKCETCGKRFRVKETYEVHMNIHKGLPPYSCELCGKGFNLKSGLRYHIRSHNNERNFRCEICSKGFLSNADLRAHLKIHSDEKSYICDVCGAQFKYRAHLTIHANTHLGLYIECKLCCQKLRTRCTYRNHMKARHGYKCNPKLYCTICEKQFTRKYRFDAHMNKIHSEKQT